MAARWLTTGWRRLWVRRPWAPATRQTAGIAFGLTAGVVGLCVAVGLIDNGDASKWFGEGKPGTLLPVGLLVVSGVVGLKLALGSRLAERERWRVVAGRASWRWGWALLGVALIVAGCDDMFRWHENLDLWLHARFDADPTGFSDVLDDLFVVGYVAPAGVATWLLRRFLARSSATLQCWAAAFVGFAAMVVLDISEAHAALEEIAKNVAAAFLFVGIAAAEHRFLRPPGFALFARAAAPAPRSHRRS